jgi:predicted PurR-regulated permease PerM
MRQNNFLRWIGAGAFVLILWLFLPFLKGFFVALLLAMAVSPVNKIVRDKIATYDRLNNFASVISAAIVTLGLAIIIFVPIALFLFQVLDHPANTMELIGTFTNQVDSISSHLPSYLSWLKDPLDNGIALSKQHKDEIIAFLAGWMGNGVKTFMAMLGEMAMIVIFFFFLMWYGRNLTLFLLPIIPLKRSIKREFLGEMTTMIAVVFYTLVGVMIAQGLAFGIFIAFFEGYNALLLGFLTGISSVIPVVGTALVWVPVVVHEYFKGNIMNVLVISIYSYAMMAFFIDNIVKLVILNFVNRTLSRGKRRINEFVIFFAIVGGLATFGFWGVILGPAIVAFAVTTLRTMRKTNRVILP